MTYTFTFNQEPGEAIHVDLSSSERPNPFRWYRMSSAKWESATGWPADNETVQALETMLQWSNIAAQQ